ncbi:hypothetical protein [Streptomyces sp. SID3343]|nr:hypothetical protein [Streptomyces sp. SID3343]
MVTLVAGVLGTASAGVVALVVFVRIQRTSASSRERGGIETQW